MRKSPFSTFEISPLMLGTVQFGLDYGVANRTGRPSYETARDILACAIEGGVNCIDTAATYGDSEAVLGRALAEIGNTEHIVVVSKVCALPDDLTPAQAAAAIETSVCTSLQRLQLDSLPVCLFHIEENVRYIEELQRLVERGWIRHIGVSTMTPQTSLNIVAASGAQAMQVPGNLLDQRFLRAGFFEAAQQRGVAVFVRSIFLQGLLVMSEEEIPSQLAPIIPVRQRLQQLAQNAGLSLAELAVRYMLSIPGVTCALVGVETVTQMQHNLHLFNNPPLEAELMRAIEDAVPVLSDAMLVPQLWPRSA